MDRNSHLRRNSRQREGGYILLTLLLTMALMVIFAAVIVSSIKFDMQRDREEELIHRGVQYSRAVRAFYKRFGRYPTKIEDLENSNNIRFLRQRYKDPMNCSAGKCQDFKLLHFGEVQLSLSGFGGGSIAGATPVSQMGNANSSGFGQNSAFGQSSSSFSSSSGFGSSSSGFVSSGFGSSSGSGVNSNSSFGQNQPATNNTTGTDSSTPGPQTSDSSSADSSTSENGSNNSEGNQIGSGQIIGGPIVGVASTSKKPTIREFNHKKKYNDWFFVYDPSQDLGMLITTPYQPQLQVGQSTPNLNGQNGTNGNNSGFGTGSSFGSSTFGNSPSGTQNNPGGFGTTTQPSNPPQQQQQ
jgi:type II secretory pathway pseudopilin PulG